MVYVRSLNLCRMFIIICTLSLCPGCLSTLQAKKRLEKSLIKKERRRERGRQSDCCAYLLPSMRIWYGSKYSMRICYRSKCSMRICYRSKCLMRICYRSKYSQCVVSTTMRICYRRLNFGTNIEYFLHATNIHHDNKQMHATLRRRNITQHSLYS